MYQSSSLGGPDGDVYLCGPLGITRKSAFDITATNVALMMRAPILRATVGLIRLLSPKSILVTDECIGSGDKPWEPRDMTTSVLHSVYVGAPFCASPVPFEIRESKRVLQWQLSTNWRSS